MFAQDPNLVQWGAVNGFSLIIILTGLALVGFLSLRFPTKTELDEKLKIKEDKILRLRQDYEKELVRLEEKLQQILNELRDQRKEHRTEYVNIAMLNGFSDRITSMINGLGERVTNAEKSSSECSVKVAAVEKKGDQTQAGLELMAKRFEDVLEQQFSRMVERVEALWDTRQRHN